MKKLLLLFLLPLAAFSQTQKQCDQGRCSGLGAPVGICTPGTKYTQTNSSGAPALWQCGGIPPSWQMGSTTDPTKLPLAGGTLTGALFSPSVNNRLIVGSAQFPTLESACTAALAGQTIEVPAFFTEAQAANCEITASGVEIDVDRGAVITASANSVRQIHINSGVNGFYLKGPGTLDGGRLNGVTGTNGVFASSGHSSAVVDGINIQNEGQWAVEIINVSHDVINRLTAKGNGNGGVTETGDGTATGGNGFIVQNSDVDATVNANVQECYNLQPSNAGVVTDTVWSNDKCTIGWGLGFQAQGNIDGFNVTGATVRQAATGSASNDGGGFSFVGGFSGGGEVGSFVPLQNGTLTGLAYINETGITYGLGLELGVVNFSVTNPQITGGGVLIDYSSNLSITGGRINPLGNIVTQPTGGAPVIITVNGLTTGSISQARDTISINGLAIDTTGMSGANNALLLNGTGFSSTILSTIQNISLSSIHVKTDGNLTSPLFELDTHPFSSTTAVTISGGDVKSSAALTQPCFGFGGSGTPTNSLIQNVDESQCAVVSIFPSGVTHFLSGFPLMVAQPAALTAQAANIGTTAILSAAPAGRYRATCTIILTQAATTSSTLPSCAISYTDATTSAAATGSGSSTTTATTTNTVGYSTSATAYIDVKAGTTVSYFTSGYASSGATPMQFKAIVGLERTM